jgi:hypothetical protein
MMKFPALALCLAGTLASSGVAFADHTKDHTSYSGSTISTDQGPVDAAMLRKWYSNSDPNILDPYTGVSIHAGEHLWYRDVLFPELMDERVVAQQVSEIVAKQQQEIAELNTLAPRAQTAGFENISSVYQHMATHHTRLADFGSSWLSQRGYTVPTAPTTVSVADETPEASIEHQIAMHEKMLDEALAMRRESRSSTVRGMLLWGATATLDHLALLRTLDSDVDLNRKTLSASLRLQMAEPGTVVATNSQLIEEYLAEERARFPQEAGADVQIVQIEKQIEVPVQVEKIVEKPVVVERVVEKIVEKPVYIQQPAPTVTPRTTQRVAGRRQTTMRARARRPAK